MSELLSDVLKIEENARRLTEDAKKKREELTRDISISSKQLHDELVERAYKKVEKVRQDETAAVATTLAKLDENRLRHLDIIAKFERENFDKLADTITKAIIG